MTDRLREAAQARAAATAQPADRPRQRRSALAGDSPASVRAPILRAAFDRVQTTRAADGSEVVTFIGYASITDRAYTMWDFFGEYEEEVAAGAFVPTLAADPSVEFVVNHGAGGGLPMAHTRNQTMRLVEDAEGLRVEADLDPRRTDVADLILAIERGDVAEMSFRFMIVRGRWSDDFAKYFIHEVDLDRGDVSPVNFGANPHTHIDSPARQQADAGEEARDITSAGVQPLGVDQPAEPTPIIEHKELSMPDTHVELAAPVVEPAPNSAEEALRARISDLEEQMAIRTAANAADASRTAPAYDQVARVGAEERTYRQDRDPRGRGAEFLTDVTRAFRGDWMAQERLQRHSREELVEREAKVAGQMQRATTTSAYTGWVVPQYLVDMNAEAAVAGRAFADICNGHELPEQGMTVYLSKVTTGTSVTDQSAQNDAASETDLDDTQISIAVRTASGAQTISRQAIERGLGVDDLTFRDLLKRYNKNLDSNLINGAATGLTNVATSVAYTDASPTAAELYPKIQAAASGAEGVFLDTIDGLTVVMHPRRWRWLSSQMTSTWPFVSGPGAPTQAAAASAGVLAESGRVRGFLPDGTPVVTDANIATNLGAGTNEDEIYAVAPEENHLWEDPNAPMLIRAEPSPKNLQIVLVVYGYYAFYHDRYTGGHQKIAGTGLVTPAFA